MQDNYNKDPKRNQMELLSDKDKIGKDRPWKEKKVKTLVLAESYERLGMKKAYRVRDCGSFLEFKRYTNGTLKLNGANFCKVRLCPMCSWRRELKIFAQTSKVMDKALEMRDYRFIFLTLTCKNVEGVELSGTLDKLFHAFKKLSERKVFKNAVKGWFRALEVTHNLDEDSKDYDTYHPHFHIIIMVNKSYFNKPELYISQERWTNLWKDSLQVEYTPIVDVRAFKTRTKKQVSKSIAETAKYTVKDNDYILDGNEEMTDSAVMVLDKALANRRLVAFGGQLKRIHKELNLDDAEDGNLINTGIDEELREDVDYVLEHYQWHIGYNQYFKK
ncbi:protein rep [Clostridium algidicarnis]|uniref:protein rep n=1 Tax=Clostridium algidicarnis TaxID=37659 RepID=UPI001C0C1225|nr:protein rep [Clostridium algidicarnis]MBU3229238.1 protein rep [Clostridium algidicarnis]MBU3252750.1 protein rep [Clostridium algidicarnis]